MDLFGNAEISIAAADAMNDYRLIRNSHTYLRLTPRDTVARHRQSFKKLSEFLEAGDQGRSVVVTHAAPSIKSITKRYRNHAITPAFASNMESLIIQHQPKLWIHGHTHESYDYRIGNTRIVCNPRRYVPNADNAEFEPEFTVKI